VPPEPGFDKPLNTIYQELEHSRYDKHLQERLQKLAVAKEICDNLINTIKRWNEQHAGMQAHP